MTDATVYYTCTVSGDAHCTIYPAEPTQVAEGSPFTAYAWADTGYLISAVYVNGILSSNPRIDSTYYSTYGFMQDMTFTFESSIKTFTIGGGCQQGCVMSGGGTYNYGDDPEVSWHIDQPQYYVTDVQVDGHSIGASDSGSYTFSDIDADHTIWIYTSIIYFDISASADSHSYVDPTFANVEYGQNQFFTYGAESGYHISQILVDGYEISVTQYPTNCTFISVTEPHTLEIFSERNTYCSNIGATSTIANKTTTLYSSWVGTISHYLTSTNVSGTMQNSSWTSAGGSTWGNGTVTLPSTVGQKVGYIIYVNDTTGTIYSSGLQTITTTGYYITVTSAYNTPTSSGYVCYGGAYATSVAGTYTVDSTHRWICTGYTINGSSTAGTSYTFTNVQSDQSITYNWKEQFYLTVTSSYNTASGSGWYDSGSLAYASLNSGISSDHMFDHWASDASGTDYALSNAITMNTAKTATASWATLPMYTITSWSSGGGLVVPTPSVQVMQGYNQRFNFTTVSGYTLSDLYIDYVQVTTPTTDYFTFNNVMANHTIYAVFTQNFNGSSTGTGNLAIEQFTAPPITTGGNSFIISAILNTYDDYNTLKNASMILSQGINLIWNNNDIYNATDMNNYVTIVSGETTILNSTAVRLSWTIILSSHLTSGTFNIITANVYDLTDNTTSTSHNNIFTFIALTETSNTNTGTGGAPSKGDTVIIEITPIPTPFTPTTPEASLGIILILSVLSIVIVYGVTKSKTAKEMWQNRSNYK